MLLFKIALRNLLRHPKKTILIGSLIAIGTAVLFCANAVFKSTSEGLETSFVRSLTGNFVLSAPTEETYGIFGSEIPIVSEYDGIPPIADYSSLGSVVDGIGGIAATTPIVSAAAQVDIGGVTIKAPVFGIDSASYFDVCSDVVIEQGDPCAIATGGVFLNTALVKKVETILRRDLKIGEPILFSMYSGGSFRIRKGYFAGIHRYIAPSEALDRVVLTDPIIVRSLCDYTLGFASNVSRSDTTEVSENLDDLFSNPSDRTETQGNELTLSGVEERLADVSDRDLLVQTDSAAWSFMLIKTKANMNADIIRANVARALKERGIEAHAISWRTAAGSSATMLFAVKNAFYVGVAFLVLGAVLIVMNTLTISVLERTSEIGSMRALGATKVFIRTLFILETMTLTIFSAFSGVTIGTIICFILSMQGVPISNPLLISLFGGTNLRPSFTAADAGIHLAGAALVGALAWIYPVSIALRIKPVSAMQESA